MKFAPVVVFPADRPASLGVARSLGRRGVSVYGVDVDPLAIGMASRYLKPCSLPEQSTDEQRVNFLIELGKKLDGPAVLFPVDDGTVMLCSRYRDELQKYYRYVMPSHETVSNLLTKDGLHHVAQTHGIPDPQMFQANTRSDMEKIAGSIPFPVIIKPIFSPSWLKPEIISMLRSNTLSGPPKVALCRTFNELLETYDRISTYDGRVIVQEVIPGEDERLVYICFYLDRQSKPLALFAGEKRRVLPIGFGSATYVRSFHDPTLEEIGLKLVTETHYQGLGGIEFKKDTRDGRYKLIEFNTRLGMWDSFGAKCGVDIPYIAYCDALGLPVEVQTQYRKNVYWIDFQRDARAFLLYRKQGSLSFWNWLRSFWVEKEWAVYAHDDWKPSLMALLKLFDRPKNALMRKLKILRE